LDGIHREPDGEEDQGKLFRRKQENVTRYGVQLRRWQTPETDGDASQMSCVSNGTKDYAAAAAATTTTTTTTTSAAAAAAAATT
jgi:hypothetical protein